LALVVLSLQLYPRKITFALAGWTFLCLLKSYDIRPFSDLMNLVPLIKSAAFYRYAPPSWEFASAVLSAFAIHALQTRTAINAWRVVISFLLVFLLCLGALHLAQNQIKFLLHSHYATMTRVSFAWLGLSLLLGAAFSTLARHRRSGLICLSGILALDAILAFSMPLLSGERPASEKPGGIEFLQTHVGNQRVYSMGPLAPNYGAYFKVAQINHNYIPVLSSWVDYIHAHLDPKAYEVTFVGTAHNAETEQDVYEQLRNNLHWYEEVGVRYVVATPGRNPFAHVSRHSDANPSIHDLTNDQDMVVHWTVADQSGPVQIDGLSVLIGNHLGTSNGALKATVCSADGYCSSGSRALAGSSDNQPFTIAFDAPLLIAKEQGPVELTIRLRQTGATIPVNVYRYPLSPGDPKQGISVEGDDQPTAPMLNLSMLPADSSGHVTERVYTGADMDIYELPNPAPYFEAGDSLCKLKVANRTTLDVQCPTATTLLRREAYYPGWYAQVDAKPAPVESAKEIFQQINIPAGEHHVVFGYTPTHAWLISTLFGGGLLLWLVAVAGEFGPNRRGSGQLRSAQ
jgi:hypothetical protein